MNRKSQDGLGDRWYDDIGPLLIILGGLLLLFSGTRLQCSFHSTSEESAKMQGPPAEGQK